MPMIIAAGSFNGVWDYRRGDRVRCLPAAQDQSVAAVMSE
jgi:hypothetical protein